MSAPLSFDHRFCAKQQLKFVCIISDSRCIEKSRWWKRLKSGQAETKLLEQKDDILSSTDLTPNYQIIQGLMSYSFSLFRSFEAWKECFFFFKIDVFKGGDEFLPFRQLLFFFCLFVPFCCCLFVLLRFIFIFKQIWVLSFDCVVHSTHSSYKYFHNHSIVRTFWTVTAQTCKGRPRRFNFAEFFNSWKRIRAIHTIQPINAVLL